MMDADIKEIFVSHQQIEDRCEILGKQITQDYVNRKPILIGLLKGSVPFMAELMKHVKIPVETEYMVVSSYGNGITSSGEVQIINDLTISPKDRDIIIVEDIVDTGLTVDTITKLLKYRGAKSVEVACLLTKPTNRKVNVTIKYLGFEIKNEFVVGFGLDYCQFYRNLPYVGILKEEIYEKGPHQA